MNSWDELVRTLAGYGAACGVAVLLVLALWHRCGRIFTIQRLRLGRWTGAAVAVHYFLLKACGYTAFVLLASLGIYQRLLPPGASPVRMSNLTAPLAVVTFFAISVHWLGHFSRTPASHVGLGFFRWREHVVLGSATFCVATPIVLAIFAGVLLVFRNEPHPFDSMGAEGIASFEWALVLLHATILAPLWEEWLVRGLLQGWLRRTNLLGHASFVWVVVALSAYDSFVVGRAGTINPAPFYFTVVMVVGYVGAVAALYRPIFSRGLKVFARSDVDPPGGAPDLWTSNLFEAEGREARITPWSEFGPEWRRWKIANARLAVVGSAMAFAVMHSSWPQQIPLFVFGLVAGWLAYRTQSLVPGIVMHALFNLVAFIVLWLQYHPGIIGSDDKVTPPPSGKAMVSPSEPAPR